MASTGGTAAPSIPGAARTGGTPASRPPGVSKAPAKTGMAQKYLNKASGKMESVSQMKAYRQQAASNVAAQHGAPKSAAPKSAAPKGTGNTNNKAAGAHIPKPESEWSQKEAQHNITKRVQGEIAAETKPFIDKGTQIAASEAATAARYHGFTGEAEKATAGLLTNQQAGAKTTDNEAAEAVRKAGEPTTTAGNNISTQNGGYVAPQVQAALQEGVASTEGIASAAQAKALTQGQGEENYLRDVQAQATQRYLGGQQQLSEGFGKERQANANEEAKIAGRASGAISKGVEAFNTRQSNTRLAEDKLQSEGVKLTQGQEKIANEGAKNKAAAKLGEAKVKNEATKNSNMAAYQGRLIEKDQETNSVNRAKNEADSKYKEAQVHNITKKLKIEQEKVTRLPLSPTQIKTNNEMGAAYQAIRQNFAEERKANGKPLTPAQSKEVLENTKKALSVGKEEFKEGGKIVKRPIAKVVNQTMVKAAEELYYNKQLSAGTKAEMQRLGLPVNYNIYASVSS